MLGQMRKNRDAVFCNQGVGGSSPSSGTSLPR